ncbi:glycine receptor subunit alpha-4-like isoform X2 [Lineus longissimus]|uniref:glycine receptor subunit alpha-4-like isoform X2 n=1 Tax=Lineus longissimus TaxID=88925 RepID=UPI002B4F9947
MVKGWMVVSVVCLLAKWTSGATTIQDFLDTMLTGYDKRIRPHDSTPTTVSFDFFVSSISSINENAMEYTISVFFRQRWNDPRLQYTAYTTPITLGYNRVGEIWVPDTFFSNEKKANSHQITVPNKLLRIHPNGDVLYSQRLSLTLSCNMDLHYFPMDKQKCQIKTETYGYTMNELVFAWHKAEEAIQIASSAKKLPEFSLVDSETKLGNCTQVYITGTYSCLFVEFSLKREIMFYVSQTFIPSILIVCLSFVSFFIDVRAVPARVSLGLITILTITTMNAGITQTLPRVAYTKAIDVWMAVCLVFVVAALLEYAIANHKSRQEDRKKAEEKEKEQKESVVSAFAQKFKSKVGPAGDSDDKMENSHTNGEASGSKQEEKPRKKRFDCKAMTSIQVENFSKIFFPSAFLVFNVVFWIFYGVSSNTP